MPETFGERVRRIRQERGMGLRDTARRVGVSATFLSRIETGAEQATPREDVIRKLAEALGDDFDHLMQLAGRIPSEVKDVVQTDPQMPEFLRRVKERNIPAAQLMRWLDGEKDKS